MTLVGEADILQDGVVHEFSCVDENRKEFSDKKLQLIKWDVNKDAKYQPEFWAKSQQITWQTNDAKDLSLVMSDNLAIFNHLQK